MTRMKHVLKYAKGVRYGSRLDGAWLSTNVDFWRVWYRDVQTMKHLRIGT